jgi:hypothetical protein
LFLLELARYRINGLERREIVDNEQKEISK